MMGRFSVQVGGRRKARLRGQAPNPADSARADAGAMSRLKTFPWCVDRLTSLFKGVALSTAQSTSSITKGDAVVTLTLGRELVKALSL